MLCGGCICTSAHVGNLLVKDGPMQGYSARRVYVRRKDRSPAGQKHTVLLSDFHRAVDVLLRFRAWLGVPADVRDEWHDLQLAILEARGLLIAARSWPEPNALETIM